MDYSQSLDIAVGIALCCAFMVLWLRTLSLLVALTAIQGAAIAALALLVGIHNHESLSSVLVVAFAIFMLKVVILPWSLLSLRDEHHYEVENQPLINIPASLLIGAALTVIAHLSTRHLTDIETSQSLRALPTGFAIVLIGMFVLATRRNAVSQITGFLNVDNGIATIAILATGGLPVIVDLGASFDVLLAVLILQFLALRLRRELGSQRIDNLQELRD